MDRHIQILLNRISCASITIATFTLLILFLHTPDTCIPQHIEPKPHQKFPKSSCDFSHRSLTSLDKKNKRLWSTKDWLNKVRSFTALFHELQSLGHLNNHSRVLCVSAGAGHEVMALNQIGVKDVTGVELVDSPPLVSRADPHNLPFFDDVFDLGFSAQLDQALFPSRFAAEMERTVRVGGVCVVAVEECGDEEVGDVAKLFQKSRLVSAKNVTLTGSKMTRIIMRISSS
uniref:Methyltransferase type 11 domain-containing protein n=1 Tax=Davidia involucrata TaxID=16924 RepID=A0A5B7BRB4_DAVIN